MIAEIIISFILGFLFILKFFGDFYPTIIFDYDYLNMENMEDVQYLKDVVDYGIIAILYSYIFYSLIILLKNKITDFVSEIRTSIQNLDTQVAQVSDLVYEIRTSIQNLDTKTNSLDIQVAHLVSNFDTKISSLGTKLVKLVSNFDTKIKKKYRENYRQFLTIAKCICKKFDEEIMVAVNYDINHIKEHHHRLNEKLFKIIEIFKQLKADN